MRSAALLACCSLVFGTVLGGSTLVVPDDAIDSSSAAERRPVTTPRLGVDLAALRPLRGHIDHHRSHLGHGTTALVSRAVGSSLEAASSSSLERRASKKSRSSKKSKKSSSKRKSKKKKAKKSKKPKAKKSTARKSKSKAKSKKSKPKPKPKHQTASYSKVPKALARLAVKAANQKRCEHQIDNEKGGFIDGGGFSNQHYCADRAKNPRYIYVDCDGRTHCKEDSMTAWQFKGKYLDAKQDRYVVINSVPGGFNPERFGLKGLGVVSVVCNGKLIHAVLGDTNSEQIGEGSVALAKACFGDGVNAAYASPERVLYIAYTGSAAVPNSLAPSALNSLGNKLISKVF